MVLLEGKILCPNGWFNDPDILLRQYIRPIQIEERGNILNVLHALDQEWERRKDLIPTLDNLFFQPYKGFSGQIAAAILENLSRFP